MGLAEAGAPERGGGARARARARARTGARRGPRGAAGGGPRPLQLELEQARVGEDERRGQEREERPEGGARGGGLPPPVEHRRGERPRQPGAPARRRLQEIRRRRAPAQGRGELGGPELLREALQEPRQEGAERRQEGRRVQQPGARARRLSRVRSERVYFQSPYSKFSN